MFYIWIIPPNYRLVVKPETVIYSICHYQIGPEISANTSLWQRFRLVPNRELSKNLFNLPLLVAADVQVCKVAMTLRV